MNSKVIIRHSAVFFFIITNGIYAADAPTYAQKNPFSIERLNEMRYKDTEKMLYLEDEAMKGNVENVKALLERGAKPHKGLLIKLKAYLKKENEKNINKRLFAQKGGSSAIDMLIGIEKSIGLIEKKSQEITWQTDLEISAKSGDPEKVKELLSHGKEYRVPHDLLKAFQIYVTSNKDDFSKEKMQKLREIFTLIQKRLREQNPDILPRTQSQPDVGSASRVASPQNDGGL